jgi:hypothetical protein
MTVLTTVPTVPTESAAPPARPSLPIPSDDPTRATPLPGAGSGPEPGSARRGPELLVALRDPADLTRSLARAAAQARAEHRPLSVVIIEPARTWTIDAAVVAVQDRRRSREVASMTAAARTICARSGVEVRELLVLRPARAWTRARRDHAVAEQLAAIARHRGAELHPAVPRHLPAPRRSTGARADSVVSSAGAR